MRLIKGLVDVLLWLLLLAFGACLITDGAAFFDERVCAPVRTALSHVTSGSVPPVFEIMVVAIPVFLVAALAAGRVSSVVTVAKLLLAAYIVTLGVPSRIPPRTSVLSEYTVDDYARAASLVCERLEALSPPEGDGREAAAAAATEYAIDNLNAKSAAVPKIKASLASALLTDMGIAAYYAFPTAEIIVNGNAPDFMIAFSSAHEAMHLFGVVNEDEANLFALAALLESGTEGLQFAAYLCAFVYVGAVVCTENRDTYNQIYANLPDSARKMLDIRTSFLERADGRIGALSDVLNDAAISLRDPRGADSYSHTSRLVVAYLLQ